MKKTLLIILILKIFSSFSQQITIPVDKLNINKNTDTLYLKKINYFNYNKNDFLIDTLVIYSGLISIEKNEKGQFLYLISTSKDVPLTYLPLREIPEKYYYMFCSNFYIQDNYLLLSDKFNESEFEFLKSFYKYFTRKSFDKKLYKKDEYKSLSINQSEKIIKKSKKLFYKKLDKKKGIFSTAFIEYVKTEIELGSINQFLNWYEETHKNKINKEFSEFKKTIIHEKYYTEFLNKKWNINSIQYFRMVQRYVNYLESKRLGKMNIYSKETEQMKKDRKEIVKNTASNKVYKSLGNK